MLGLNHLQKRSIFILIEMLSQMRACYKLTDSMFMKLAERGAFYKKKNR